MSGHLLDRWLSGSVRGRIEQAYYARISEQARLENLVPDPGFWETAYNHPAFFSDHGVVHVRDVARQILQVLKTIHGVLIPHRSGSRMEGFMYGYGVMVSYLHDIGMSDLSPFGRAMHPEFAAQAIFSPALEDVVESMWAENSGNVPGRLLELAGCGDLHRDPKLIFRELLALSVCHSKSKVPITILDDPGLLRPHMQLILSHSLRDLYLRQQLARGEPVEGTALQEQPPEFLPRYYSDFAGEAFDWLVDESPETRELVCDATDTLRALRCADALRQRGTVQKTSAGYEVFISQQTGEAIYALRLGDSRLYLLESPDPFAGGESNIASSELDVDGNLRISFHRGAFASDEALSRAAYCTAFTINDILGDIVESFRRRSSLPSIKTSKDIQVLLESTDDNPHFVELVQEQLRRSQPGLADRIQTVPSLRNVSELERNRYLEARELDWDLEKRQETLERVRLSGQKIAAFDLAGGFRHAKIIELKAGEMLIQAGVPSAFVYIPLRDGLKVIPLGGYESLTAPAWMPLGNTGVIRGNVRNADVRTEKDVSLLVIPKEIYLRHWYAPYSFEELRLLIENKGE